MTNSVGPSSGEILVRLMRLNPMSSGIYGCEIETSNSVNTYGYPSMKEMIVRDPTHRINTAHKSSENSAVAIVICTFFSLLYATHVNLI